MGKYVGVLLGELTQPGLEEIHFLAAAGAISDVAAEPAFVQAENAHRHAVRVAGAEEPLQAGVLGVGAHRQGEEEPAVAVVPELGAT